MIYAQIKGGRKLHIAMQPGEADKNGRTICVGELSYPICGTPMKEASSYRMTCNLPLGHACKRCVAVYDRWSRNAKMYKNGQN